MTSAQPKMREPLTDSQREWLQIRDYLGKNRFELGRSAAGMYPRHLRIGPTPLLTNQRWALRGPVPLNDVGPPAVPLGPPACANAKVPDSANAEANAIVVSFMGQFLVA